MRVTSDTGRQSARPPWLLLAAACVSCCFAAPGWAQDRDYCTERPGLGTSPCTIAPGHVSLETGLVDWQRGDTPDARDDTVVLGDTLVRIGATGNVELQWGWTPYGQVRTFDKRTRIVDRVSAGGDMLFGLQANLRNPDGSGFSAAVRPFVTVPVGRGPIGAGAWTAGLVVPLSYDLGSRWSVQFSAEADDLPDADRRGRHLAYSGTLGVGVDLAPRLSGSVEFQAARDDDPAGHVAQSLAAASLAWMPTDDLQLDIGGAVGLDAAAPAIELYTGISRRF